MEKKLLPQILINIKKSQIELNLICTNPDAPDAPDMPPFPSSTQIVSNKDDKGNTIIRLEQNGKPTEIIVKDGVVFIDGKQTENGKAIQINDEGGNSFSYSSDVTSADGKTRKVIREETFVIMEEGMEKEHKKMMEQHDKAMRDMDNEMKKHDEDMKLQDKDKKQHDKDMKKHNKEMRIVEKKIIKEQGSGEEDNDFGAILRNELKKDNLIKGNAISFELSKESLVLNGEKQPDAVQKKYLELFEKTTGNKLSKGNKVVIQEN
jgi:predicted  nucleic acid-binding Zn-ribbon protein